MNKYSSRLLDLFKGKFTPTYTKPSPSPQKQLKKPLTVVQTDAKLRNFLDDILAKHKAKSKNSKRAKRKPSSSSFLGKRSVDPMLLNPCKSGSLFDSKIVDLECENLKEKNREIFKENLNGKLIDLEGTRKPALTRAERIREIEQRYKQFEERIGAKKNDGKKTVSFSRKVDPNQQIFPKKWTSSRKYVKGKSSVNFQRKKQKKISDNFYSKNTKLLDTLQSSLLSSRRLYNRKKLKVTPNAVTKQPKSEQNSRCFTSYSGTTNSGLYRDYNEDRISIIQSIILEDKYHRQQESSFFALMDGHAGSRCVDYVKDNIHCFITSHPSYYQNKQKAIVEAIKEVEDSYLKVAKSGPVIDISGTCLLISIFHENTCYIANVGDSRTVMSKHRGQKILQLTNDHKPEEAGETDRITKAGGNIFRNKSVKKMPKFNTESGEIEYIDKIRVGPHRVFPGGLSVSRTIGDLPSKEPRLGGNPGCVVATPETSVVKIDQSCDFMVLACDGVYDMLTNEDVVEAVWKSIEDCVGKMSLEEVSRMAAEHVMKVSFDKRSLDNISVIVILFKDEEYYRKGRLVF